jgi:hypothetical protein
VSWRSGMQVNPKQPRDAPVPAAESGSSSPAAAKPGRIAGYRQLLRAVVKNPSLIGVKLRYLFAEVWGSKGGGFYGIGYVFAFLYFELAMLLGDLAESESADGFVFGQLFEMVLRLSWLSFINVFQALLWPLMVAEWWQGGGLLLLLGGYVAFQYLLKPRLDRLFPELGEQRQMKVRAKLDRSKQKTERRARRDARRKRQPE